MRDNIESYKIQRGFFIKLIKEKEAQMNKMKLNRNQHVWIEQRIKELAIMRAYALSSDMIATTAHEQSKRMDDLIQADLKIKKALNLKQLNELISWAIGRGKK